MNETVGVGGSSGDPQRVVVVGNGMVGHRFCERLLSYDRTGRYRMTVLGEERRPAYDRVHLTNYFTERSAEKLLLATPEWYAASGIELLLGTKVKRIDRERRVVVTDGGDVPYDVLVLATGSSPFVPPLPGVAKEGVFVYRTIEDLDGIIAYGAHSKSAAVLGGGLLGLEAARAVHELGLTTHVIEVAPRLMPRQLDVSGAALLDAAIRALDVKVLLDRKPARILGEAAVRGIEFSDGEVLDVDMVVISAGIRPRDELAREAGIATGERGGILVDDGLRTSDPSVFAIGEVALHQGMIYGLVAPGYEMADVLAKTLTGDTPAAFVGADLSAKLKLLGVDVASFGDPFLDARKSRSIVYENQVKGVYRKLVLRADGKALLGGILVGDAGDYGHLLALSRSKEPLSDTLHELGFDTGGGAVKRGGLADDAQVCSCNNVLAGAIRLRIRDDGLTQVADVKTCTKAGTGCGGCLPLVADILNEELAAAGRSVKKSLCEHFAYSRQELYQIVCAKRITSFGALLAEHGKGHGCEICKPTVASILASVHNEPILAERHQTLQDSNDRFLANIQKNGTYSVVPRVVAGEITPDQLIALGQVAKKYALYTKITGGQRIDLFGARVEQLPDIWEELVAAGFESGHAYGKAVRTVKSCVGSTWCRYGVQDSTAFAVRIENRYKGIRAPHKLKCGVSGCARECAEAQGKDFGVIATERGWNVYVGGNGGMTPRHADLLVADIDEDTAIRYLDRFVMFYIRTADRLTRTSVWLEKMEGGIEHLRNVIVNDSLGIAADLERDMGNLVGTYVCEWTDVLKDPKKRERFRHFAGTTEGDPTIRWTPERGQRRPDSSSPTPLLFRSNEVRRLPVIRREWVRVASVDEVASDGGISIRYGDAQIALFHFASRNEWYATQNLCPHKREMVLARGILGDQAGTPKVACPLHKKTFDLESGKCLSGDPLSIATFPVRVEGTDVYVELPPMEELERIACSEDPCAPSAIAS